MLVPLMLAAQFWDLRYRRGLGLLNVELSLPLAKTGIAASISLAPYIWSLVKFDVLNPIVATGYIDYSLISVERLGSYIFDLNQGLIVGLPLLFWAVPVAIVARAFEVAKTSNGWLRHEDVLLIGFVLVVLPTLAQINWNSGHSVFLRYAAWAGMLPLVWAGVSLGSIGSTWKMLGVIPALVIQAVMVLSIGGVNLQRFPNYVAFMPWVPTLWQRFVHFYDPLPEIYYERLVGAEKPIVTPAIFRDANGKTIIRVLTNKHDIDQIGEEVCGHGVALLPLDSRLSSYPKITPTERGFYYLTGRVVCSPTVHLDTALAFGNQGQGVSLLTNGWSYPEPWGTWSDSDVASLDFLLSNLPINDLRLDIVGLAFVTEKHPEQIIKVFVNNYLVGSLHYSHPSTTNLQSIQVSKQIVSDNDGLLAIEFRMNPISPADLAEEGKSSDGRRLGLGLISIKLSE